MSPLWNDAELTNIHLFDIIVNLNQIEEVAEVSLCQKELMRTSSFDVIAQMEKLKGNMERPWLQIAALAERWSLT